MINNNAKLQKLEIVDPKSQNSAFFVWKDNFTADFKNCYVSVTVILNANKYPRFRYISLVLALRDWLYPLGYIWWIAKKISLQREKVQCFMAAERAAGDRRAALAKSGSFVNISDR